MMNDADVRHVVRAVLDAERATHAESIEAAVVKAINATLMSFGIDADDPKEMKQLRADLDHLRKWRTSVEQAQSLTFRVVITMIVTGFVGAVWLGIKAVLALKS
jgi:hypothetical protein